MIGIISQITLFLNVFCYIIYDHGLLLSVFMVDFIILAAGNGSRMHSSTPKIFQEIAGKPCISYVIDVCKSFPNYGKIIVVTKRELANNELFQNVITAIQEKTLGTADAIKAALPFVQSKKVIVMCADMPLINCQNLLVLNSFSEKIALIAMEIPDKMLDMPYGRLDGKKIIEYKDANDEQRKINIANTGIYSFQTEFLLKNIDNIENNNKNNEYYLTDILNFADPEDIHIHTSKDYWDFHGINTMKDISEAELHIQKKLREQALNNGVKMLDPNSVYFSINTNIEKDVIIEQNVVFKGTVEIKSGAIIKAFSYIEDSKIMSNAKVGPFARIRGGTLLSPYSEIGNFVEVKGSTIGERSKSKHLAYIGDANIGENVNIGAGAITCNYDGFHKHQTVIESDVMVGANCSLVAPINIKKGTIIAAGSTVTTDTEENTLAIARSRQENKKDGAIKIRKLKGKS